LFQAPSVSFPAVLFKNQNQMKKFLLSIMLFAGLAATAQQNYPRYFQQVNKTNTNRFTTGGGLSYRYLQLTDSILNDTISILPSALTNIYTITGSTGHPVVGDSIQRNIWINSSNINTYLNDEMIFNITLAAGDTLFVNTNFSTNFNTEWDGPGGFTLRFIRLMDGLWANSQTLQE